MCVYFLKSAPQFTEVEALLVKFLEIVKLRNVGGGEPGVVSKTSMMTLT